MVRLFKVSIPSSVLALVVSEAILALSCYVLATYWVEDTSPDIFLLDDGGWWRIALVVTVILLGLYFHDLYDDYRVRSRILLVQQFCMVLGIAFLLQALFSYGRWDILLPKWLMVYGSVLVLVVLPAWRITFASLVWKALGAQRVLFLGASSAVREMIGRLGSRPELGLAPIGYLESDGESGIPEELSGTPRLGCIADLDRVIASQHPDRIVVGMTERRGRMPVEHLLQLRFSGIHIEEAAMTYETLFGRVSTRDLRPSQLIFSAELGPQHGSVTVQSAYSLLLSAIGIMATIPVMAVVAILVKLTSPGPVLHRQQRVGLNGVPFTVFKFRSMYREAEAATGAVWATKDDPRVTPVGRWLRKLRLDELPQLFNVLRGEMSLVGPRPERPEFVAILQEKIPYYRQRLCVKPGITGWAQINHKYGDTVEDSIVKLEYDLYYIKNLALSLDAYILFHTMKTILLGRGAQ
jgi:exopolysaccharide biosynthesis polyprenyl glycosylphosphotransferase